MWTNVLCGVDPSSEGDADAPLRAGGAAALDTATRVCREEGARLHLLSAVDAGDPLGADAARARLERLAAGPRAAGVATTVAVATGGPVDALLDDAARHGRDLVVCGTRERTTFARFFLGSTALGLLRRAPLTVWVAKTPLSAPVANVVCAIDVGDLAPRIVSAAARVAGATGAELHVLHVVDIPAEDVVRRGAADAEIVMEARHARRAAAEKAIPELVAKADLSPLGARKPHLVLPDGDVNPTILRAAGELRADVVVLGSVVHTALGAALRGLGRTAEAVLPRLDASLVVVKP